MTLSLMLDRVVVMRVIQGPWLLKTHLARHPERPESPGRGIFFGSWNFENLFDDQDDPRNHDEEDGFARDPDAI